MKYMISRPHISLDHKNRLSNWQVIGLRSDRFLYNFAHFWQKIVKITQLSGPITCQPLSQIIWFKLIWCPLIMYFIPVWSIWFISAWLKSQFLLILVFLAAFFRFDRFFNQYNCIQLVWMWCTICTLFHQRIYRTSWDIIE